MVHQGNICHCYDKELTWKKNLDVIERLSISFSPILKELRHGDFVDF